MAIKNFILPLRSLHFLSLSFGFKTSLGQYESAPRFQAQNKLPVAKDPSLNANIWRINN